MNDFEKMEALAIDAARQAGAILKNPDDYLVRINSENARDIKLQADEECEKLIRSVLGNGAPYPVVGEEFGGDTHLLESGELYWVVDPLDGTFNYAHEVPLNCVSIALCQGEDAVLGVIYDFNRDELFHGVVGRSLCLNGVELKPQWAESLDKASLQTGFPTIRSYEDDSIRAFVGQVQAYKKIRMIGSAALALAWTASGRFDAYLEEGIRWWDVAAGMALMKAAGGFVHLTRIGEPEEFKYRFWAVPDKKFIVD